MRAVPSQAEAIRDARLRARISEALSQATNHMPPQLALNLRPLLQQGRMYLNSVSSAALREGLQQFAQFLNAEYSPAELLPLIEQSRQQMTVAQQMMAAPFLRPVRKMLEKDDAAGLNEWRAELRDLVAEVLAEDAEPALRVA